MSFLSIGRPAPTAAAGPARERTTWWSWNPARRPAIVETAPVDVREPWWRWNPYRRAVATGRTSDDARRDEHRIAARRPRRRAHPILGLFAVLTLAVLVAAASGAGFIALAYQAGSFAGGGAVIDRQIAQWRDDVVGAAGRAGEQGGEAVQTAGQSLSIHSQQLVRSGG